MARAKVVKLESQPQKVSWGESYSSLLLGMVVVVVIGFIIFSFARNKGEPQKISSVRNEAAKQEKIDKQTRLGLPKTYTVAPGDDLWSISEKLYKSGYNWVDIAKANKLGNPDVLHAGIKLTVPDVKPKIVTIAAKPPMLQEQEAKAIKGESYTIVSGDNLWEISVRAYGDGFRYVEIAKANNLSNPDLIFAGNKLKIPR
jgi:putative chitinase